MTLLKSSCSVSDIPSYNARLRRLWPECDVWRDKAMAEIRRLQPDLVVVSQFSSGYIEGPLTSLGKHAVTHEEWAQGLWHSLSELRAAKIQILLLRDTPAPGKHIVSCLARSRWRGTPEMHCDASRSASLDSKVSALEGEVAASLDVTFGDLSEQFCEGEVCSAVHSGVLVYRDSNHLTTAFAARQAPALLTLLANPRSQD